MKRFARTAALVAAVGLALPACSAHNGGGSGGAVKADGSATVKARELTIWTSSADAPYVRTAYKEFGQKYGVKMNLVELPADGIENQVQTKWASGDRPDLLEFIATALFCTLNTAGYLI